MKKLILGISFLTISFFVVIKVYTNEHQGLTIINGEIKQEYNCHFGLTYLRDTPLITVNGDKISCETLTINQYNKKYKFKK